MKQMAWGLMLLLLMPLLTGCGVSVPTDARPVARKVRVMPDNDGATLPPNIAPLNFEVMEAGDAFVVRYYAKDGTEIVSSGNPIDVPVDEWHELLRAARGDTLYTDIYVKNGGSWSRFPTMKNPIATDSIDEYISYRLIQPSYVDYEDMDIRQRNVSDFDEHIIFHNMMLSEDEKGQCINCHVPQNQNLTGHSLFHVRQLKGGTVLIDGAQATKVNLKTDSTLSAGVYPAWHPKNDQFIAFSVNETGQVFHTRDVQKIEVIDFGSNLILYDAAKNQVFDIDCRTDEFETFPTWSPDGQWLYYVSAHYEQQSDNIDAELNSAYPQLKYNIYRRSFNAETRKFGERELVLDAAAMDKSASTPRISPDGKWILFALADYGQFHIWHNASRLYAMPTGLGTDNPDPQTTVHPALDPKWGAASYHSFSSNGRWVVFSSRRDDGNYTRLYIAYFDSDGRLHTPFLLPQRSPRYYTELFRSYNVPEFLARPVSPTLNDLTKAVDRAPLQAEYAGSSLLVPEARSGIRRQLDDSKERIVSTVAY